MAEIGAASIPDGEARLQAMEANGADYLSFKGIMNAFRAGYTSVVDAIDAKLVPVADAILALQSAVSGLQAASAYVTNSTLTVAGVISTYPASAANLGKKAKVSDLYGRAGELLSYYDGVNYRWIPTVERGVGSTTAAGGTVPIIPLVTEPTFRINSTSLTSDLNITPSSTNAYIGQRNRIIANSALPVGIYVTRITGLVGSNLTLLGGNMRDIEYGATGWFASS